MGFGKRLKGLAEAGKGLQQQAIAMQQQAMAMQEQAMAMHRGDAGGTGGAGGWDPTTFMLPPSEFVKRGNCDSCGGVKQLPTVREYLYCDFCGKLMDYDLQRAGEAAASSPTITDYAQVANQIGPEAERVRKAGDRDRYRELQRQLYAAQAQHTPWAVPPRAWNDEGYRRGWIDYSTEIAVVGAFDPTAAAFTNQVRDLSIRLQWKGGMGLGMLGGMAATVGNIAKHGLDMQQMTPKVEPASFWPLAETVLAQSENLLELIRREGINELDPDGMPPSTSTRMTRSALAQGWLGRLEPDDGQRFIEWLGLRHEYQRAEVHSGETRHCAGCGYDLTALPGATRIVCDSCGRVVDLASPQVLCTGCNAQISFVDGAVRANCPYCHTEVRRV
jgi:predicted RNA-binding Zn-ribbon protein involved in translation (DUF1610 family)